ncbi:MAG: purine-nucleoside phosphorylase [Candidatus Glassbacteria bacterium]|nr:purine-nucleoside phosphorylase [Candidatus Glassbacteria bacterium]
MSAKDLYGKIGEAAEEITGRSSVKPDVGIVLGTGLGKLVERLEVECEIPYPEIPHFVSSTVETHAGKLLLGSLNGKSVVAMQGRFHFYEGYSMEQITFPVRVMKALGAGVLVVSNACGGMNPLYGKGDLMIIEDHINLLGANPLIGANDERLGPRFPDMSKPYSRRLIGLAERLALENEITARKGIYVAVPGPNLETRAEYRFLRWIGADVVGMSTVPEVIVAIHAGMEVLGLSIVTDLCFPDALEPADISEIIAVAADAEPRLTSLMSMVMGEL